MEKRLSEGFEVVKRNRREIIVTSSPKQRFLWEHFFWSRRHVKYCVHVGNLSENISDCLRWN